MIVRFIVFIIISLLLWWLYRNIKALIGQKTDSKKDSASKEAKDVDMVQCEYCKIYTPKTHAVKGPKNTFFCSQEHKEK
ncbi:PP0621 family protein [Marinomonas sp. 2405UD68-3]|uniref:PP0621 family protein n=1 Tax=Marinomonas sp. 2405UD68-3 TaxID=3391835 RepID=UPI0039C98BAD